LACFQLPAQLNTRQIPTHPITTSSVTFEHIGEEQGINRTITCIFEDHLGYLWFGAGPEGLYRYNGYEFKHYEYIVGDTTSLPHNLVYNIIHEDKSGNLWLYAGGVITRYNRASNDFTWFTRNRPELPWNTWAYINSVVEDQAGKIWLGSYGKPDSMDAGGLLMLDPLTGQITHYLNDPADSGSLNSNCVSSLLMDEEGVLWVGTCGMGVDRFIPAAENRPAFTIIFFFYHLKLFLPNYFRTCP
jgi:ligand-binding sensor domain-containing protein